jgi:hypothetical protein
MERGIMSVPACALYGAFWGGVAASILGSYMRGQETIFPLFGHDALFPLVVFSVPVIVMRRLRVTSVAAVCSLAAAHLTYLSPAYIGASWLDNSQITFHFFQTLFPLYSFVILVAVWFFLGWRTNRREKVQLDSGTS